MLKWILRIAYAFLLIIVAVFVFREADADRRLSYLTDNANEYYETDNLDGYISEFMVATSRSYYIETPLYQAVSSEAGKEFRLSIFHTRAVTKQGEVDVLTFTLTNLNINVTPENALNYAENENLIRVRVNLNFSNDEGRIYQDYNLKGETVAITSFVSLGAHIPIEISIGENKGVSLFGLSDGTAPTLDSITLELVDYSENKKQGTITYLASIANDPTKEALYGVVDNLVIGEGTFPNYVNKNDDNVVTESLVSTSFNGEAARYNIGDIYEEDTDLVNIISTDLSLLDSYRGIVIKYFVIFGIIAVIVTYLLFFLKPTINYYKDRKYEKMMAEREIEVEPIFQDQD